MPSRQRARAVTGPAGVSRRTTVSGSSIGTMPVSSSTVTVQMEFEPDIGGYSVGSMMMTPASQSSRVGGTSRLTWRATLPRGSLIRKRRMWSWSRSMLRILSNIVRPGGRQHAADDDVADLAFGMASHERYQALASHLSRTFAVSVMAISAARTMRSSSIDESSAP